MTPSLLAADDRPATVSTAPFGCLIALLTVLALVLVMHHPVGRAHDAATMIASINQQATLDRVVHGALSAVYGLLTAGMLLFASRLGVLRPLVLVGLVAFGVALVLMLQAIMIDGFIVPEIATRCIPALDAACADRALGLFRFGALQIEVSTRFALSATVLAVLACSVALLRTAAVPRWTGAVGLASAALQLAAFFAISERLTPHGLVVILLAQGLWYVLTAYLMISRPGPFADRPVGAR